MDDDAVENPDDTNPELVEVNSKGEVSSVGKDSSDGKAMQELVNAMNVLTRLDMDFAYSYDKSVNIHMLLTNALAWENDFGYEAMDQNNNNTSEESLEKALVFDLLSATLDCEVKELDSFMNSLQAEIDDARQKIFSSKHLGEMFNVMEEKLHDTEKSWEQSHGQVLDTKMLSTKLRRACSACEDTNCKNDKGMDILENSRVSTVNAKLKLQTAEQQRHMLRMVDRSLGRELDLEKRMIDLRENEEQLKLKLHHTEQVAFHMEEAAEVVWGRFLEAENASEVLMGISKDLLSRLQIVQFNLNGSMQRETAANSELQNCLEKLKTTETALQKLGSSKVESQILELAQTTSLQAYPGGAEDKCSADGPEVVSLREKVKLLENQLKESEERLKNANASIEASQDEFSLMEDTIESLRESNIEAETRAESAEAKVTELTETNLELTEELNFLKGGDNKIEKVSLLEKELRELEIQLQHAKASSEASQEQQNMLYSAIWDMETLIEDLKSKVSKAEIKTETAEENCLELSETNFDLNKELNFMRMRMESLEASLRQANDEKAASAEDVNIRSKLIMDMVVQLAIERERIQKELYFFKKQNNVLAETLRSSKKETSVVLCDKVDGDAKHDSVNTTLTKTSDGLMKSFSQSLQVDESSNDAPACETDIKPSTSATNVNDVDSKNETVTLVNVGKCNIMYVFMAILVVLISDFNASDIFIEQTNLTSLMSSTANFLSLP